MPAQNKKYNILIVEDHELTRFGLKTAFSDVDYADVVYEAATATDAFEIVKNNKIDVIIMDLGLPEIDGISAMKTIREKYPDIRFVVLTSHSDKKDVIDSLRVGANAYCAKDVNLDRLKDVVYSVIEGAAWFDPSISDIVLDAVMTTQMNDCSVNVNKYNLTKREKQILKLITEGLSNVEIAKNLFVSVNTTKVHVASILQKLEVDDRLQAALKAIRENLV